MPETRGTTLRGNALARQRRQGSWKVAGLAAQIQHSTLVTSFTLGFSVPETFRSQKKRPRPEQKELTNLETVMNKEGAATKD